MSEKIPIKKTTYNKGKFSKVIDTQFRELNISSSVSDEITIEDFFRIYENLISDISKEGNINSHRYILNREAEYLGVDIEEDEDIQNLLQEITDLREQLVNIKRDSDLLSERMSLGMGGMPSDDYLQENAMEAALFGINAGLSRISSIKEETTVSATGSNIGSIWDIPGFSQTGNVSSSDIFGYNGSSWTNIPAGSFLSGYLTKGQADGYYHPLTGSLDLDFNADKLKSKTLIIPNAVPVAGEIGNGETALYAISAGFSGQEPSGAGSVTNIGLNVGTTQLRVSTNGSTFGLSGSITDDGTFTLGYVTGYTMVQTSQTGSWDSKWTYDENTIKGVKVNSASYADNAGMLNGIGSNGFAPATGSTHYIQNQTSSAQDADYWIDGRAKAGTLIIPTGAPGVQAGETALYSISAGFSGQEPSGAGSLSNIILNTSGGIQVAVDGGSYGVTGSIDGDGGTFSLRIPEAALSISQTSGLQTALNDRYTEAESDARFQNRNAIISANVYTGFKNPSGIVVSYDHTSRTITLTGDLVYYWKGTEYNLGASWTSTAHTATPGVWFLYSTDGITFGWSQTAWQFIHIMVASVRYAATAVQSFAMREVHGMMDWNSHQILHYQIGTHHVSGGGPKAGTYEENIKTNTAITPGFNQGVIRDEDCDSIVAEWTEGSYSLLHVGSGSVATFTLGNAYPFTIGTSYIRYNNPTLGTLVEGSNKKYYNVYQILLPAAADSNSQNFRTLLLQPQREFGSLEAAQSEDVRTLNVGDLSGLAPEFVIYTRITYYASITSTTHGKVTIPTGGISYVLGNKASQTYVSGLSSNAHNILSNLGWVDSGHYGSVGTLAGFSSDLGTAQEYLLRVESTGSSVVYRDTTGSIFVEDLNANRRVSGKTLIIPNQIPVAGSLGAGETALYSIPAGFSGQEPSGAGSVTSIGINTLNASGLQVSTDGTTYGVTGSIQDSGEFKFKFASGYRLMTVDEGVKLEGIAEGANNYVLTKSAVETVLTGAITSHTHAYLSDSDSRIASWNDAYNDKINSVSLTTSTLTLTQQDGGTLTASVPTWNQSTTGSAAKLTTARAINITVSGISGTAQNFDGSAPITIPVTLATLTRGSYLTGSNYNGGTATTWAVDATTTSTASKIVARDANADVWVRDINASRKVKGAELIIPTAAPTTLASNEVALYAISAGFSGTSPSGSTVINSIWDINGVDPTGTVATGNVLYYNGTIWTNKLLGTSNIYGLDTALSGKQNSLVGTGASSLVRVNTLGVVDYDNTSYATVSQLSGYALTSHTHTFASLTSKPTTLSGYGISSTDTLFDGKYIFEQNAINSDATKTFPIGKGITLYANGSGSSNFPATYGAIVDFSIIGSNTAASWERDFSLWKQSASEKWYLRGYSGTDGSPLTWRQIWHSGNLLNIGTTASTARTALELTGNVTSHTHSYEAPITAGTTLQYWRGDKSWQTLNTLAVPELTNLYFTEARVRASVLTGFAVNNAAILATDSVLVGFGKAQGQINARALSSDLTAHINNTSPHLSADERAYFNKLKLYLKIAADNTSMYSTLNFYSESGVSAFGIGSGGGGGVGVDVIDDLLSVRTDAALSANQGRILKGFVDLKQPQLNGTGFVKANGTSISYDNNSYALASHNHSGVYHPLMSTTFSLGGSYVAVRTANRTASQYYEFWDSGAGWAKIYSGGFVNASSSDSYILLGGGGTKAISDFALASTLTAHTGSTANPHSVTAAQVGALALAGGSVTGTLNASDLRLPLISVTPENWAELYNQGARLYLLDVYNISGLGTERVYGTVLGISGRSSYDKTQLIFNGENGHIQYRKSWYNNSAWSAIRTLWDSSNLLNIGTTASSARDALGLGSMATETASNYLPLSGGYMTLNGVILKKAFVGGGWARQILRFENSTASIQASLGAYGTSDSISYMYLGFNAVDSNNLRVYSDKVQFGNSLIYHSGNSNSSSVAWAASTFTEGGVSLASKYLGISSKAADSDKLDGMDSSRFVYGDNERKSINIDGITTLNAINYSVMGIRPSSTDPSLPLGLHSHVLHSQHPTSNDFAFQLMSPYGGSEFFFRKLSSGVWGSPYKFFHSGNLLNIGTTASSARTALGLGSMSTEYISSYYTKANINAFFFSDTRTITPQTWGVATLQFGFTSMDLNNGSPYADFMRFGGYGDSSGGRKNIILFKKSEFGIRQYQGDFASATYNHGYVDYWHTGNLTNTLSNGYLPYWNGSSFMNSGIKQTSSEVRIADYLSISGTANYMGVIGFNRNSTNGAIINPSYGAFQIHNNNGTLYIQSYISGGALNANNTIQNNGNVGIGYTDRSEKLAVNGSGYFNDSLTTEGRLSCGNTIIGAIAGSDTNNVFSLRGNSRAYGLAFGVHGSGNTWIQSQRFDGNTAIYNIELQPLGGKVDIGYGGSRTETFAVNGNGYFNGVLTTDTYLTSTGTADTRLLYQRPGISKLWQIGVDGSSTYFTNITDGRIPFMIYNNGRVSLGENYNNSGFNLQVNGISYFTSDVRVGSVSKIGWEYGDGYMYNWITNSYTANGGIIYRSGNWTAGNVITHNFQTWVSGAWSTAFKIYQDQSAYFTNFIYANSYIESASYLKGTSVKIGANWEAIPNGSNELELRYGGVMKAKLSSSGDILAVGGVTAFAV